MKRNTPKRLRYFSIVKNHRERRRKRNTVKEIRRSRNPSIKILAPAIIDLYHPKNHAKLTRFLASLRTLASKNARIFICLRDTYAISASGGILFLSEIDRLVRHYGASRFTASFPKPIIDKYGTKSRVAQAVLHKIGFYRLLNMRGGVAEEYEHVKCWESVTGTTADGSLIGHLLNNVEDLIGSSQKRILYRGACEALSNACEHAYMDNRNDGLGIEDKRWWMFTARKDDKLNVLVCDLGIGIPNTIHRTQPPGLIAKILSTIDLGSSFTTDGAWIQAATLVKRTRTEESHRGKGGSDLRMLVENDPEASLSIFSNKGRFRLSKKGGQVLDYSNSIHGTIVEWNIKVTK